MLVATVDNLSKLNTKQRSACTSAHKLTCAPIEDSDQPLHQPGLMRVFDGHSMGTKGQRFLQEENFDGLSMGSQGPKVSSRGIL